MRKQNNKNKKSKRRSKDNNNLKSKGKQSKMLPMKKDSSSLTKRRRSELLRLPRIKLSSNKDRTRWRRRKPRGRELLNRKELSSKKPRP